jgi:single-stranded DNA-binding protein
MPNFVFISGKIDSEVKRNNVPVDGGTKPVANFRINDGKTWISVAAWGALAGQVGEQGAQVQVTGRLTTRSYDKDGTKVYVTEVVASTIESIGAPAASADDDLFG